jgi:hypothetical protein
MGADLIEHVTGEFSRAVFVKGGSGDPTLAPGTVDSVTGAPTFTVASLVGYGNDYFNGWFAYAVWDSAGGEAAPQGESQAITDYVSATGTFSHAVFTAALVAGDKVIISLLDPTVAVGDATIANQTTIISGQEGGVDAVNRVAGATQIFEKSITSPANDGNVLIGTITTQPCLIKSVVVHADATGQADLTSAGIYGGAAIGTHTITFISAADAVKANLDIADEQVGWTGAVRLAATKLLAIELLGTGATDVDITVIVGYMATANGGYIT